MANGDSIDTGRVSGNTYYQAMLLLDATASGADNGVWIDTRGFPRFSVDVRFSSTGTVQVMGSNAAVKPSNATDGIRLTAADTTVNALIGVDVPCRWVKAKTTANAGTITATLHLVSM